MANMPRPFRSAKAAARLAGAVIVVALSLGPVAATAADACSGWRPRLSAASRQGDSIDALEGLGVWVEVARYGMAWQPCGVAADWRPYFHGSWTWTERGWFWVSAEPWGRTTYHYGRWHFDAAHGWVWLAGRTWAPAWVAWRWNDKVIGWAPLEPGGTRYSAFWTFVPAARFAGEQVEAIAIPGPRVPELLLKTRPHGVPANGTKSAGSQPRIPRRGSTTSAG
jgi:hypothetical protein